MRFFAAMHWIRPRTVAIAAAIAVLMSATAPTRPAGAYDYRCSPNIEKWYADFYHDARGVHTIYGGHTRTQKTGMTPSTIPTSPQTLHVTWLDTAIDVSGNVTSWAELGYGYNPLGTGSPGGPEWYYYYKRTDGSFGFSVLAFDATADGSQHDVVIYNVSGTTYQALIDSQLQMYATGIASPVLIHVTGIENQSCNNYISQARDDEFTILNPDGTWTYWPYGGVHADAPASAGWILPPDWTRGASGLVAIP